jgi:signal transduction histidine kinase/DNA-binding response OmpR family regulator
MNGIWLPIAALTISIFLIIIFFSKKSFQNKEVKSYLTLIILNFFFSLNAVVAYIYCQKTGNLMMTGFFQKIHLSLLLLLSTYLFLYNVIVANFSEDTENKLNNIFKITSYVLIFFIFILPIETISYGDVLDVGGVSYSVAITGIVLYFLGIIFMLIRYFIVIKKNYNKIIPFLVLIILYVLGLLLRVYFPEVITETYCSSFVLLVMYFTIENPDMKLINQLENEKLNAEQANKAKTEFLSSMSHEIRTPLNAIVGFSESIKTDKNIEQAQEDADNVINASQSLLEIINGILDISKIESGSMDILETNYSPIKVYNEIIDLIKPRIGEKPIMMKTQFGKDLPSILYGDVGKVKEIISNILTNAVKYTDQGAIFFTVNCVNETGYCKQVISVEDTGRGIKPEKIDKLFTKFNRLEEDRNTTLEGTGLGLAITKSLVDMMGGKIIVQSIYGNGSKFTVYLTQKIVEQKPIINLETPVKPTLEKIDFSNKKILIVDDNKLNIKVAERILKDYGIVCDGVLSGQDCLNKIDTNYYDLILMDDMMPQMSGTETMQKIREIGNYKNPIVVLTANAVVGEKEKYLKLGFDDYLAKPINKQELLNVLNKLLFNKKSISDSTMVVVGGNTSEIDSEVINKIKNQNKDKTEILKSGGIDVEKGLSLLGDIDMYNETLKIFLDESKTRIPKMQEYIKEKDMANYAILAHAQKSDSKYLGFTKLAELSLNHELKGKDNDIKYVDEHYDELLEETNRIINIAKKYFGEND